MDRVYIEGLRCRTKVGVPDWERKRRQPIELDLELGLDLRPAGRHDRVEKTIDYAAVAQKVKGLLGKRSYRIVEAMAEDVAQLLLAEFRPIDVRVKIRKFSVPGAKSVGVEITRRRR